MHFEGNLSYNVDIYIPLHSYGTKQVSEKA